MFTCRPEYFKKLWPIQFDSCKIIYPKPVEHGVPDSKQQLDFLKPFITPFYALAYFVRLMLLFQVHSLHKKDQKCHV